MDPQRILIVGSAGAGKSTFARELGRVSGLPVIHLDVLFWRPGWVEPSHEEWAAQLEPVLAEPRWILDGNYGGTMKQRARSADLAIFVERPRLLCEWRAILRYLRNRNKTRIDVAPGCPEQLDPAFLRYIWAYPTVSGPKARRRLAEAGCPVVVLRNQKDLDAFLATWPRSNL